MKAEMASRAEAACKDEPTSLFFPIESQRRSAALRPAPEQAKQICDQCPVKAQCLTHALTFYEEGVWGGTSTDERRQMRGDTRHRVRPPRAIPPHGSRARYRQCKCDACRAANSTYLRSRRGA